MKPTAHVGRRRAASRLVPFSAGYFGGAGNSYAGMGRCSNGDGKPAVYAILNTAHRPVRAACNECGQRWLKQHDS